MNIIQKVKRVIPENPTLLEKVAFGLTITPILGTALVGVPLLAGCLLYRHLKRKRALKEAVPELPTPTEEGGGNDSE